MLGKDEVRVLREEAVGMYQAVVLEAGSAAALKRWMDDNGYKYPTGMDAVCEEYIALGWCFVAEKAKVGGKTNVDPKPRMKGVDTKLPSRSAFDGHVTGAAGTGNLQKGHAVGCGDWDRDGNVDLVVQMGGAVNGDKYHNILSRIRAIPTVR